MYGAMPPTTLAILLLMLSVIISTESLECISCTNVRNVSECLSITPCASNEHCFTHVEGHGPNALFTLGCRNIQQCLSSSTTQQPSAIIGRGVSGNSNVECSQCCAQDYCNKHMCSLAAQVNTSPNSQCQDDADYSCEAVGSTFNLCGDILHAKTSCKKWCGLCDLVDGGWSAWSSWSACDVTCSSGHNSRQRTCTYPIPVSGGSDCVGPSTETSSCVMRSCPVHGGWSPWSSWRTCSKTCGVGLERRDRSCSKPYPGPDGDPCFGDARDDRTCFIQSCADGNWSTWSGWGNCSAKCDGGLQERTRTCDNPAPSTFGKYCVGDSVDTSICNTHACQNGNWSAWSQWGSCSATCNGGIMQRSRTCDNPTPSTFGKSCVGNNVDTSICNNHACKEPVVYFTVNTPNRIMVNGRPVFTNVLANVGNGYNTTSAQFVCTVSGVYQFSTTFVSTTTHYIQCYLFHNSNQIAFIQTTQSMSSGLYDFASYTINIHLDKGDTFELSHCTYWDSYVYTASSCMFTGVLLSPS